MKMGFSQNTGGAARGIAGNRMDALDIAKGIGIIFVIFAHVNYTPELLVLIYSFHMPLFFILSGVMFSREKYPTFRAYAAHRWKNLIVPYLLFSFLSLVYVFASERLCEFAVDLTKEKYITSVIQVFLAQGSANVLNTPLWFVPCLLAVEIMYFYISKLKTCWVIVVCAILACCGWVLESGLLAFDNTKLFWSLDSALFALSFYATGNILSPYLKRAIHTVKASRHRTWICIAAFVVCFVIWLPLTLRNGKISLGSKVLNNGFLLYLTGTVGTMGILAVSVLLEKCRFLKFLGTNTFCLMSVHYMIRKFTIPKYYKMLGIKLYSRKVLSETILPFLIIFALSVVVTIAYRALMNAMAHRRRSLC